MNDEQLLQYSRQIMLPEMDIAGQEKLLAASVLIVGLGGLGCPAAMYLAAAGIGRLVLADFDEVDLTNIQRQIAHNYADVGVLKAVSAQQTLQALNPHIAVDTIAQRLAGESLDRQVAAADVVLDCSDNFTTRFAVNAACVARKKPLVSAAAIRMEGQLAVFDSRDPLCPCYRCLYKDGDDAQLSCAESGVIAPLTGIMGTLQALEVIKLLVGFGESLRGRLLVMDVKYLNFQTLAISKNQHCPVCGSN